MKHYSIGARGRRKTVPGRFDDWELVDTIVEGGFCTGLRGAAAGLLRIWHWLIISGAALLLFGRAPPGPPWGSPGAQGPT